jgi:hypothetical protein
MYLPIINEEDFMKKNVFLMFFFSTLLCGCTDVLNQIPVTVEAASASDYLITFINSDSKTSIESMPGATIKFSIQPTDLDSREINEVWYEAISIDNPPKVFLFTVNPGNYEFVVPQYPIKIKASTKARGS